MAKSTQLGHTSVRRKAERRFDIVSTDIMGPFTPGVNDAFARFHKQAEAKFSNQPLHILRSDCAKEFVDGNFRRYCDAAGITIEDTSPYAPQLNGVAERMNRTLTEKMRAIMFDAKIPTEFWPNAIITAAYLINRSPTCTNPDNITPFELWHSRKPDLSHLRVFGCLAHRFIPEPVRNYAVGQLRKKGYQVLYPTTKKIVSSCDVRFNENRNFETMNEPVMPVIRTESPANINTSDTNSNSLPPPTTDKQTPATSNKLIEECVPLTYRDIRGNPFEQAWKMAVTTELQAMHTNGVFEIIP